MHKTLGQYVITARRSNQSILKEINPEYTLEGVRLKLKLQYFGHLMPKADSLEKTRKLGKIEGRRRRTQQRMDGCHHGLNGPKFEQALGDGEEQGSLVSCSPWGRKKLDMTERLNNNNSMLKNKYIYIYIYISIINNGDSFFFFLKLARSPCGQ